MTKIIRSNFKALIQYLIKNIITFVIILALVIFLDFIFDLGLLSAELHAASPDSPDEEMVEQLKNSLKSFAESQKKSIENDLEDKFDQIHDIFQQNGEVGYKKNHEKFLNKEFYKVVKQINKLPSEKIDEEKMNAIHERIKKWKNIDSHKLERQHDIGRYFRFGKKK